MLAHAVRFLLAQLGEPVRVIEVSNSETLLVCASHVLRCRLEDGHLKVSLLLPHFEKSRRHIADLPHLEDILSNILSQTERNRAPDFANPLGPLRDATSRLATQHGWIETSAEAHALWLRIVYEKGDLCLFIDVDTRRPEVDYRFCLKAEAIRRDLYQEKRVIPLSSSLSPDALETLFSEPEAWETESSPSPVSRVSEVSWSALEQLRPDLVTPHGRHLERLVDYLEALTPDLLSGDTTLLSRTP
jgi:hypothetical protein